VRQGIDPRKEPALTVVLLAQACAAAGDTAGAEQALRQAAVKQPGQVVLLDALGKVLERQGRSRLEEAIGYYRTARGQLPDLGISLSNALIDTGRPEQAEEVMQELVRRQPGNAAFHYTLGRAAYYQKKYGEAQAHFGKTTELNPGLVDAYVSLGIVMTAQQKHNEAERFLRMAILLKPDLVQAYVCLGGTLNSLEEYGEAERYLRKALALAPDNAEAHNNFGSSLIGLGRRGEAETEFHTAIALNPDLVAAHNNLGSVLSMRGEHRGAEAALRKAVKLDPGFAEAYCNLGVDLVRQGRHGQAESAFRKAIELNPALAEAYMNLGSALSAQGRHGEAEADSRKAIDLKPGLAEAYYNLGNTLLAQRRHDEAEAAFRKTIDLRPGNGEAHTNLGIALVLQGRHGEAEAALRKAVGLNPGLYEAHRTLGVALMQQSQFDGSAAALKQASKLLPALDLRHVQVRQLQQQCQRYKALDARLPAVLRGTEKPDAVEQLDFAGLCVLKKRYATAARLYADAFTAAPRLAEDPRNGNRYDAAGAAALAGCGRGEDGADLDFGERARWREQARQWLRADLAAWTKALDSDTATAGELVRRKLTPWRTDLELAGVREPGAMDLLPAGERKEWLALWAEVSALLKRTTGP
jgi:tetratricopeptide (TPR) repeat protein